MTGGPLRAQVLAATYQAMGLLPAERRPGRYDPGSFWSGDHLHLSAGYRLGGEIAVHIPAGQPDQPSPGSVGSGGNQRPADVAHDDLTGQP